MTEEQLQLLAAELANARYDGLSAEQASVKLFATVQETQATRPKELTILGLMGAMSNESKGKICDWVHLIDFRQKVLDQDRVGVGIYADMLLQAGKITQQEYAAVATELIATETVAITTPCDSRFAVAFAGIEGFPNTATLDEFAAAWQLAGRG